MKLHGHPMSNHALRVQALLEEFEVEYELHIVDFEAQENQSEAFLKLNPNGKVPVLEDGDVVLWESHAIMRYLCEKYERFDWYPKDMIDRINVEKWLDWCHTRINPEAVTIAFNTFRNTGADEKITNAKGWIKKILPVLEGVFKAQPYLCGDKPTIADLSLLSSLMYLKMCNAGMEEFPITSKWYDQYFSRSKLAKVLPAQDAA